MADGEGTLNEPRVLPLRYGGRCEACGAELPKKTPALWIPARKKIRCLSCAGLAPAPAAETTAAAPAPAGPEMAVLPAPPVIERGVAGAAAAKKYERLATRHQAQQEAKVRSDAEWRAEQHARRPVLGRIRTALGHRSER
jgi:hypothetical protein